MKRPAGSTVLLVTGTRIARADFDGTLRTCKTAPRSAGGSPAEAVRAALALGGSAGTVWVLSEDAFVQRVTLNPAQVAGLTPEQLGRALSFEVEPFSGIPVMESATGFHDAGESFFTVVEMSRADRDGIQRAVTEAGGKLAGITHPGTTPDDEETLRESLGEWLLRLQAGALPLITPPAPAPSPNRFLVAAAVLEAAALLLLFADLGWKGVQRVILERRNAELAAAGRELDAATKQVAALKKELLDLEKDQAQRERVVARRGALLALLNGLGSTRTDDVVVRGIEAEGPSIVVVSGISLEAGAVDEMSIVLTQTLRAAGWSAQPRHKTGKKNLASGGPWEFSLTVTHEEATRDPAMQISQREPQ
jgi:hypothetical protein